MITDNDIHTIIYNKIISISQIFLLSEINNSILQFKVIPICNRILFQNFNVYNIINSIDRDECESKK